MARICRAPLVCRLASGIQNRGTGANTALARNSIDSYAPERMMEQVRAWACVPHIR
jgi:hypothetical protein